MCRPCTGIDENSVQPQEIMNLASKAREVMMEEMSAL